MIAVSAEERTRLARAAALALILKTALTARAGTTAIGSVVVVRLLLDVRISRSGDGNVLRPWAWLADRPATGRRRSFGSQPIARARRPHDQQDSHSFAPAPRAGRSPSRTLQCIACHEGGAVARRRAPLSGSAARHRRRQPVAISTHATDSMRRHAGPCALTGCPPATVRGSALVDRAACFARPWTGELIWPR